MTTGAPPRTGWARLAPELIVDDLTVSRRFWCDLLTFEVAYARPDFVYLERAEGAQIMLCGRDAKMETGALEKPFGRGVLLQVYVDDVATVARTLADAGWPLHAPLRDVWRQWGDREGGQRELWVQDPDGYLIMVAQHIGERAVAPQEET